MNHEACGGYKSVHLSNSEEGNHYNMKYRPFEFFSSSSASMFIGREPEDLRRTK
jgi:hypothetical protein